ncbi:hypothetical protein EYF80_048235 [Liparis tanakae]|uniref:Uncharacterized protein n=1 Tax=Liparis tanakae TaxID=230148 RepID=A0A4Z2FMR9_9TELE|nr:hypothetical protein EYF80_048235 [Liparis tanakae]
MAEHWDTLLCEFLWGGRKEALVVNGKLIDETVQSVFDVRDPRSKRLHRRVQLLLLPLLRETRETRATGEHKHENYKSRLHKTWIETNGMLIPALSLRANCQHCESVVLTNVQASACVYSADLVKTPEAKPNVELLALASTSSSVSKGSTDMTGPKISSFTQVMSSLQSSASGGGNRQDCTRCTPGPNISVISGGFHSPSANSAVQTEMNTMRIVSANMVTGLVHIV